MPRWIEVEEEAPEIAAQARAFLDAFTHKVIATLRKDGSPRVSGTECLFTDGDLWFGSMWRAVKALDLRRDPRFALHSGSADPPDWKGDAKILGRADEVTDPDVVRRVLTEAPEGPAHLFRADVLEVSVVSLAPSGQSLVIEAWHAGHGVTKFER